MLQAYISGNDFRSSNNIDDIGYNLYVIDKRYQKNIEPAKPNKIEFKFSENVPLGIYGFALVSTINLVCISSHG